MEWTKAVFYGGWLAFYFTVGALTVWCQEVWLIRLMDFLQRRRNMKRHAKLGSIVEEAMEEINTIKKFSGMDSEAKLQFSTMNDQRWRVTVRYAAEKEARDA